MKLRRLLSFTLTLCLMTMALYVHAQTGKKTTYSSRIISYIHDRGNFLKVDSTKYHYTTKLGGAAPNLSAVKYTTDTTYTYFDTAATYARTGMGFHTLDASGNILYDSSVTLNTKTSVWYPSSVNVYTYDAHNNVLSHLYKNAYMGVLYNNSYDFYTYDASNNEVRDSTQTWSFFVTPNAWVNYTLDSLTYNSSNQVTVSYVKSWDTKNNSWDINNNLTNYTYTSGYLTTLIYQKWNGKGTPPAWVNNYKYVYVNDASGNVLRDTTYSYNTTGAMWVYSGLDIDSNDASGNQLSDLGMTWHAPTSTFLKSSNYTYTYNSFNQLTSTTQQSVVGAGWGYTGGENQYVYHYELDSATGINQVNQVAGSLQVFPVPAANVVNIDINFNAAQPYTVAIYDMQGRVVRKWQEAAAQNSHRSIPVNNFSAGNYMIVVDGAYGQLTRQMVIAY